ncbi:MAG: HlyD family secretion protein [Novosphingobium sp.]|nr:HlyD family secretion protein [Novosphingobium sp.]
MLLLAGGAYGLHWWTSGRFRVATDNAYVRADVVTIAPRIGGEIVAVAVTDDQWVRAGAVLARIDARDYRAKVEQAEGLLESAQAEVAAQQARIANLDARTARQRGTIAQAAADLSARQADAVLARREYQRQLSLESQEVTSVQIRQSAEAAARRTGAQRDGSREGLAVARAELPVLATERTAAVADLDKARGALRQACAALPAARLDLSRTVIRAPVSGRIGQRSLRAGHYVEAGTPLMAIVPAETYVVANYKETQTYRIRARQSVRISVDALGGTVLRGHVESLAPASGAQFALLPPDNATGNFTKIVQRMPLRIRIDPGQREAAHLRPGMSVETSIDTADLAR